jgi:catecholate siderophore receptor
MKPIKSRKHVRPNLQSAGSITTATLLTGLALAPPLTGWAQTTASTAETPNRDVERITVFGEQGRGYSSNVLSSQKFTQPLVDTTQTISVIGSDLFNEQGATSLTEALRNSPGVGTFYAGENGSTSTGDTVYMRGFDSSSSIFVDSVRDLGSITRDLFNVEQVEVAKGPAGTDNGRSSPTGAINMVTKQPFGKDYRAVSLSSGAADEERRATADLNYALDNGRAVRLNLMTQDSGLPGRDEVNLKRWGIAPSFAFGLDTDTRYFFDLLHVDQDNVPDGGVSTIGLPGYRTPDPARPEIGMAPKVDSTNFYGTTSDFDDVVADMVTFRVEHDFGGALRLQNTTRWGQNDQDYLLTSFMASQDPARFSTPDLNDPSTWEIARSLPTFKNQTNEIVTNQTNVNAEFSGGAVTHDLSFGAEITREELDTLGMAALNGTAWPAANLYHPDPHVTGLEWGPNGTSGHGRTDTLAVYAFETAKLGPRWQLNGGIRLDDYETTYSALQACGGRRGPDCGGLPDGSIVPGVDGKASDTLFNWKAGVLFKPAANGSLYANYAISQQPPGGSSLELSASANNANNPIFDPQKAETAELGTKWNLFGDNLLLSAALYNTDVINEIVQDPIDQLYYQNGKKRVRGVEFNAVGKISDAWSLAAGFTTMDAEVENGPNLAQDGSRNLTYTPDKALTAWTTYAFPFGLTIGGGVRYSGEMHRGTDGAPGTPDFTEAYTVWDAVITYEASEHLNLRLNANNLLDEDYVAAINKSGYRYTPGVPRSFLLTANLRF